MQCNISLSTPICLEGSRMPRFELLLIITDMVVSIISFSGDLFSAFMPEAKG